MSELEKECTRLFNSHSELQQDVYELCVLVLDIASNTASRRNQARRDVVDSATDRHTPNETSQQHATRQFVVRFDYDPFKMSPNADPESELSLTAGDRVTVFGRVDSVSRCHLELPLRYVIPVTGGVLDGSDPSVVGMGRVSLYNS